MDIRLDSFRVLATGLGALVGLGLILAPPALAAGQAGSRAWKVTQTIKNTSPYQLRLRLTTLTELSQWRDRPSSKIDPGDSDRAVFDNDAPAHGPVGVFGYDAYAQQKGPDRYVGSVMAVSAIDCTKIQSFRGLPICGDYHRWEVATVDSGGALKATWTDDAGSPDDFHTTIFVDNARKPARGKLPKRTGLETLPRQVDPEPLPPNFVPWYISMTLVNKTDYQLRYRTLWNNEGTHFQKTQPIVLVPGASPSEIQYGNSEIVHGPSTVFMYDLYDPRSGEYRSSVFFRAATDCTFIVSIACVKGDTTASALDDGDGRVNGAHVDDTKLAPFSFSPTITYTQKTRDTGDGDDR